MSSAFIHNKNVSLSRKKRGKRRIRNKKMQKLGKKNADQQYLKAPQSPQDQQHPQGPQDQQHPQDPQGQSNQKDLCQQTKQIANDRIMPLREKTWSKNRYQKFVDSPN